MRRSSLESGTHCWAGLPRSPQDKRVRVSQPLTRGPSAFIPEKEVTQADTAERTNLLVEEYSTSGRLDNVSQVMGLHAQYLESFLRGQFLMLRMDGPLPLPHRHYIAIMAAARHRCSYLINMHVDEFLKTGGSAEWLNGLAYVPQRLRNLNEINKLLAHRPWLITKEHIQELVRTGENNWSLPELVHAVVLLAHYHALASFVLGSGINPESEPSQPTVANGLHLLSLSSFCVCDLANDNSIENTSLTADSFGIVDSLSELEVLMQTMKRLQDGREEEQVSPEEMNSRFDKETKDSLFVVSGDSLQAFPLSDFEDDPILTADVSRYIEDPGFGYEDFARRGEEHLPTFRAQDYTWENHGFSLVNRLYSDIGHLLDDKFRMVCSLTHEDVDTSTLHRALFNYVHCMFGIRYDDYDYGEVNQLLERSLKVYVKTVACYPERTTKRMYDSYWRQFRHAEKVQVNLLLMEARMQAELLYALRAITRHLT
ncbi:sestrin-3 isoform X2 [Erinaceus europaeus]|uniref:Sestrin-3 isoform X2 n=1 Tax=Erinaceus europaeus TaxID=9365 RepID=A0A1S3W8B5_ERIEU|nr:sestrin-3 isoform X2 [Erinaceus europaeus]